MQNYKTDYKDYSKHIVIMISTDQLIFNEKSSVRMRMIEHSKHHKEMHIIIFSTKRVEPIKISDNCTIYSTKSFFRPRYVTNAQKIGKDILRNIGKDEILLVSCQNPFETGLVGKCLSNLFANSELLLQIHTDLYSPYFTDKRIGFKHSILNKINLFISRSTIEHAQVIRVVSRKIADSLVERKIDPEKIIIKPIDVDTNLIKNSLPSFDLHTKYPKFKKIVLMASRLEAEKNVSLAIDAMEKVIKINPEVGLIIVGSGCLMNCLKKQSYKLGISKSVVFVGWQTDMVPYYKGSDVFLMTSWYEGYGMVFKEAEAAGCKIVSTDVGIAREVNASIADWNAQDVADKLIAELSNK